MLDDLQESFKKEFNVDKQLKKEFDKNYRELSIEIDTLLTKKFDDEFAELFEAIYEKKNKVEKKMHFEKGKRFASKLCFFLAINEVYS